MRLRRLRLSNQLSSSQLSMVYVRGHVIACRHGHIKVLRELRRNWQNLITVSHRCGMIAACGHGQIAVIRELRHVDWSLRDTEWLMLGCTMACKRGQTRVLREIRSTCTYTKKYLQETIRCDFFVSIPLLRELRLWGFTALDLLYKNSCNAFVYACKNGLTGVLHELRVVWELHQHIHPSFLDGLVTACALNRLQIIYTLRNDWGLTVYGGSNKSLEALMHACAGGHVRVIRELFRHWNVPPFDTSIMRRACENGHHLVVKELRLQRAIHKLELCNYFEYTLLIVADRGHVQILQELRTHWPHIATEFHSDVFEKLYLACNNNHLPVVQELRTHWGITTFTTNTITVVCKTNNVDLLRELETQWNAVSACTLATKNNLVEVACEHGSLEILQDLRVRWHLDATNARENSNQALRLACKKGHLSIVQELRLHWGLTAADLRRDGANGLYWACKYEHIPLVREFKAWGLTMHDIYFSNGYTAACMNENLALLKALHDTYGAYDTIDEDFSMSITLLGRKQWDVISHMIHIWHAPFII